MNIDWSYWLDRAFKLLEAILKPSLAKAISLPLLLAGIGILNSPLWLDIVNWWLYNQEFFPQFKGPISEPKDRIGWIFIILSILVYLVDTWRLVKTSNFESKKEILDAINEQPQKTADIVAEGIKDIFCAPHIVDEKINKQITEIQSLRFFRTFPKEEKSIQLGHDIIEGELAGGSPPVKALGLALAARYLSVGENIDKAKSYLEQSKMFAHISETSIAEAFIKVAESGVADGLSILASDRTPANYSAIFMLKRNNEDSKAAIAWLDSAGLTAQNLDVDGQISYISALLEIHDWERALDVVCSLNHENPAPSPALAQVSAFTFLINAIKVVELRESVMQHIPFSAETFPLADDVKSISLRTKAITLFKLCSDLASDLGSSEVADVSKQYALWLELRNPDTFESARNKLQNIASNYSIETLEYLPLIFAFRIDVDCNKIEDETNRQTALCSDTNPILGVARFVLALNQKGYPKVVEYINTHRNQLEKFVNRATVNMFEVEALAKSGLTEDAEALLTKLEVNGADSGEVKNLRKIIASVKGEDPIALAISQYNETKNASDLAQLVNLLERSGLKEKYHSCALELFTITGTEVDALKVANATSAVGQFSELHRFLVKNFDLAERSEPLMFHWAWSLFRKGDFAGAKECLSKLKEGKAQHLDFQTLDIHLAIYSGNWDALTVFVENKWENRRELNAEQLMQAAQLAKAQSPGRAKEILEYATSQFPEDPIVLASAYFTATTMGWEDNDNTGDWLNKAAILSSDEGPLHMASFDELRNMIEAQRERRDKVFQAYEDGTAPIFTIAQLLNRTLSDFYLIQPLENLKATDIRKKSFIGAFHSARQERIIEGDVISIDASSTLVLGFLGLLDLLFDSFHQIIVPHSLLRWLYDEKQKIAFHQPSQIQKAKEFEALVSDDHIEIIEPTGIHKPELALNVGDELAFLLENAKESSSDDNQVLVACSYPVYKVGSFREQVVNLPEYKNNLTSCIAIVKKLKEMEAITEEEYQKASKYLLQQHDKEWPSDLVIEDQATIYLDSLSVTYFMTIGMLDKFKRTELSIFVHRNEFDKFKKLRGFDSTIREADIKIEQIRNKLFEGTQSGKIVFSEMQMSILDVEEKIDKVVQPTEELLQAFTISDAALIDDRFMNQHANIAIEDKNIPIYTSLDLIETLCDSKIISQGQKFSYRAKLRESGFGLVPITIDELNHYLVKSKIVDGIVRPTKELKLIKENLSLLKINRLIKLPRDAHWLHSILRNLSSALKQQWANDVPTDVSCARADWLYGLLDFRGWAHCFDIRNEEGIAYIGETIRANSLLIAPEGLSRDMKAQYNEWLEHKVLLPLKNDDIASYEALVESIKQQVGSLSKKELLEGGSGE